MSDRNNMMLAVPFDTKKFNKWHLYYVQPKLNGHGCKATMYIDTTFGVKVKLTTTTGKEIVSVPHIEDALVTLGYEILTYDMKGFGKLTFVIQGELFSPELSLQEISSIARRTKNIHPEHKDLEYHMFDCFFQHKFYITQEYRLKGLKHLSEKVSNIRHLKIVSTLGPFSTYEDGNNILDECLKEYLEDGYEGIIVRNADANYEYGKSQNIMKIKPKYDDEYKIVGFKEEISIHGEPKAMLGAFILKDKNGNIFNCGSGLTHAQKVNVWDSRSDYLHGTVKVKYQELSRDGIPQQPVVMNFKIKGGFYHDRSNR